MPKQYTQLNGAAVLTHTLRAFLATRMSGT